MTYKEVLKELSSVKLSKAFTDEFESYASEYVGDDGVNLLERFQGTDKIKSTATLIRLMLRKWENESEKWLYWQKVMLYFMKPEFARNKEDLPNIIEVL